MKEFNRQIANDLKRNILEFNTSPDLVEIRNLYKQHFDTIKHFIEKFGHKQAIEDIADIDSELRSKIFSELILINQINNAIATGVLTLDDIK